VVHHHNEEFHHMSLHFLAALVSVGLLTVIYTCIVTVCR
jgi:hypothetical protein